MHEPKQRMLYLHYAMYIIYTVGFYIIQSQNEKLSKDKSCYLSLMTQIGRTSHTKSMLAQMVTLYLLSYKFAISY